MDDHTVTGRVAAVIDAVAEHNQAVSLAALTRLTGIPKPTVRRIAADLVARGLLDRCEDGYLLGGRLLDWGARAAAQHGLRLVGTPHIHDLFARSGAIAWVYALTESAVVPVSHAFGARHAAVVRSVGMPMSRDSPFLPQVASGRILLAHDRELLARLRERPLTVPTRHSVSSWARLGLEIDVVRDTGVAVEHEQGALGYSCLATGLHGPDGALIGMIGVTGLSGTLATHRLAGPLVTAANAISSAVATEGRPPAVP
ncbi:IclR family transcriptional regulator [Yinghuangia seranimata]|uniref:IclR family transcriptional regulator n=1 Tax=Yinghuangia seranimata TaxID=408067 RepID=UPI00248B39C3|nr:helix-turn-helix domain-containing protein [Yinghuangia seranimata]MDI2128348.1 helix-turn-helix domain-containing protein [Yinghuangia seranimata]